MIDCSSIVESVIFSSKLNIAASVLNMIGAGLLIYGTIKLRQANRHVRQATELLNAGVAG